MNAYLVSFGSNIVGSHDSIVVMAKNETEALKKGKPMLNTHKLSPDFLNKYGSYSVRKLKGAT
jgi:hypothetical protein